MATSWPTSNDPLTGFPPARTDYGADKAVITARVDVLHDQIVTLGERTWQVHAAESSRSTSGYATYLTAITWIPDYAAGRQLRCLLDARVDSGTGQWRLRDSGSGDTSSAIDVTQTSYVALSGPASLAVDADWADSRRTIEVQYRPGTATTITLRSIDLSTWYFED